MATLPYSKTTIRDLSQFNDIGAGINSINIATVINSKTGPMERMTLNSFDDLVTYYCPGSKIVATDDITLQNIGAMLNTTPVDVIRVGTANMKVGRSNLGDIIYTDKDYNLIPQLSKMKLESVNAGNTYAVKYEAKTVYVGDAPDISGTKQKIDGETSIKNLVKGYGSKASINYLSFDDNSFNIINSDSVIGKITSTEYTTVSKNPINVSKSITGTITTISTNNNILIGSNTYVFIGDGSSSHDTSDLYNPIEIVSVSGTTTADWFLSRIISKMPTGIASAYCVKFDLSREDRQFTQFSQNIQDRIIESGGNKFLYYNKSDVYNSLYMYPATGTGYFWNCEPPADYAGTAVKLSGTETDLIQILNKFEQNAQSEIFTPEQGVVCYLDDITITTTMTSNILDIDNNVETEFYNIGFTGVEYIPDEYWVRIQDTVYFCNDTPTEEPTDQSIPSGSIYVRLANENLAFDKFLNLLFRQLESERLIGRVNSNTILFDSTLKNEEGTDDYSAINTITLTVNRINQVDKTKNAKFAVIANFPCSSKLFSYSFIKDSDIEDFNVLDITYKYNQISSTVKLAFEPDAVDGYGNALYYTKYNEGQYSNRYVHFIELNAENETPKPNEIVYISQFGNEVIMSEPEAIDYANAIKKFNDYEDRQYAFIWDSGYANPILAKAMITIGQSKNAQVVPSFPSKANTVNKVLEYHESIGSNSFQVVEVVPSHKSTYCGSFLSTVPGSLSYILARVNSYNNTSNEFQPLFGANRGAVTAPNLLWNINKTDQQKLADKNINCIVNDINGTYLNFNLTSQKVTSYLSEEQNVYMSNVIAHVCQETNPMWIAELNNQQLWDNVINILTKKINDRMISGKSVTLYKFRVICDSSLNTQESIEARQLKYKVEVQYTPSTAYILAYEDVVRLNSF